MAWWFGPVAVRDCKAGWDDHRWRGASQAARCSSRSIGGAVACMAYPSQRLSAAVQHVMAVRLEESKRLPIKGLRESDCAIDGGRSPRGGRRFPDDARTPKANGGERHVLVHEFMQRSVRRDPDRPALICGGRGCHVCRARSCSRRACLRAAGVRRSAGRPRGNIFGELHRTCDQCIRRAESRGGLCHGQCDHEVA